MEQPKSKRQATLNEKQQNPKQTPTWKQSNELRYWHETILQLKEIVCKSSKHLEDW